jgi:hypothetical protein
MHKKKIATVLSLGFATLLAAGAAHAYTYSARVKSACKTDFYKFCPSYKLESVELRNCMQGAGFNISPRCLDALADAGEIPRKYHSSQRKKF